MSEPVILAVKPGSINSKDKRGLRKGGIIVIEIENPRELKLLRPSAEVDGGTLLKCAMEALCKDAGYGETGAAQRNAFARALNEYLNPKAEVERCV